MYDHIVWGTRHMHLEVHCSGHEYFRDVMHDEWLESNQSFDTDSGSICSGAQGVHWLLDYRTGKGNCLHRAAYCHIVQTPFHAPAQHVVLLSRVSVRLHVFDKL